MIKVILIFFVIIVSEKTYAEDKMHLANSSAASKNFTESRVISDDSAKVKTGKSRTQKINFGGIFLSPYIGVSFPIGGFNDYSKSGFAYGFKAEIGFNKLYPFVFGVVYEGQTNPGNPEFTTTNVLNTYDTKITSVGGSVDFILNKYVKSNFTSPILTLEVKYTSVTKDISPITNNPDIPGDKNLLTYSAGLGFTIYVFDFVSKYTFADEYSNLNFLARIHIPIVRF
ncbi:MAG: hypothetical protein HGGPFJEG_01393 [Ignavibacteria bacterium]|nr:hypothetical protein [Ignavibacteria bacterium]